MRYVHSKNKGWFIYKVLTMAEYVEREALLKSDDWQSLKSDFDKARAHIIILGQPAADVVSRALFEQILFEHDLALATLEEHGIGLGQIKEHGEWLDAQYTYFGAKRYECSLCRDDEFWKKRYIEIKENYCPNCGAKMDGRSD